MVEVNSIIATIGHTHNPGNLRHDYTPPLNNQTLFKRDANLCMYCGLQFRASELTRDHITPLRAAGLALIVAGDLLVGGPSLLAAFAGGDVWKGDLLFMAAAACWAAYSVTARRHAVDAVQATIATSEPGDVAWLPDLQRLLRREIALVVANPRADCSSPCWSRWAPSAATWRWHRGARSSFRWCSRAAGRWWFPASPSRA